MCVFFFVQRSNEVRRRPTRLHGCGEAGCKACRARELIEKRSDQGGKVGGDQSKCSHVTIKDIHDLK